MSSEDALNRYCKALLEMNRLSPDRYYRNIDDIQTAEIANIQEFNGDIPTAGNDEVIIALPTNHDVAGNFVDADEIKISDNTNIHIVEKPSLSVSKIYEEPGSTIDVVMEFVQKVKNDNFHIEYMTGLGNAIKEFSEKNTENKETVKEMICETLKINQTPADENKYRHP